MPMKDDIRFDFYKSTIYLNQYELNQENGYTSIEENSKVAAEHELGHAMGLKHNYDDPKSVMYWESLYPIQPEDIQAVKKLYHEK